MVEVDREQPTSRNLHRSEADGCSANEMPPIQRRLLSQRSEAGTNLLRKELRLFPGGEVGVLVDAVVIDQFVKGSFRPTPRSRIDFTGKMLTAAGIETFTALSGGRPPRAFSQ